MQNLKPLLLIIPFCLFSCLNTANKKAIHIKHFESGFSLYLDTIFVDIKGRIKHALKYHDKYYTFFEEPVLKYGGRGKRWLYVFSEGQVEKIMECPKLLDGVYWDFFVKNDSIIIMQYLSDNHFYLDTQNFTWQRIDTPDDLIFEDEKFIVYSSDFGEWGGKTWFKDKETGTEYEIESTTPLINKIDSAYYLTNPFEVLRVANPRQLNICSDDVTYENIGKNGKQYNWYGESIGFDTIYQDATYDYFEFRYNPRIVSSFVWDNALLHIYEIEAETYIARIDDGSLKPIQKIGENLRFYRWMYSYRSRNTNGNNELLMFHTDDEQMFGLMKVVGNKIYAAYMFNSAELKPKPQEPAEADSVFVNRLSLILSDLGELQLGTVDLSETTWGSFDITPNIELGIAESYYPNPNGYKLDICKSYLIMEDSLISNSIRYYGTKANGLVRAISLEWEDADLFLSPDLKEKADTVFGEKLAFLENVIERKAGKSVEHKERENYTTNIWKTTDGFTIILENMQSFNRIRIIIYNDD